jgi:hypothetical protein
MRDPRHRLSDTFADITYDNPHLVYRADSPFPDWNDNTYNHNPARRDGYTFSGAARRHTPAHRYDDFPCCSPGHFTETNGHLDVYLDTRRSSLESERHRHDRGADKWVD